MWLPQSRMTRAYGVAFGQSLACDRLHYVPPHPSASSLLPNGGGVYGFWFVCFLLLCLGLNLRLGFTIWLSSEEERVVFQLCAKDSRIPTCSLLFIQYSASDLRRVAAGPEWSMRRQTTHSHHTCTLRSKTQDSSVKPWLALLHARGEANTCTHN